MLDKLYLVYATPLSWLIVITAIVAYARIINAWMELPRFKQLRTLKQHLNVATILVTVLPLLGLLGTIMGMQSSFSALAFHSSDNISVTFGIQHALMTTLLGLVFAIPGWTMLSALYARYQRQQMERLGVITQ